MSWWATSLLVGSGGFVGANLRYWLTLLSQKLAGEAFPWGTMLINVSGSLLIGIVLGLFLKGQMTESGRLLVAVGVLGGYTTFSAFSYEALNLVHRGQTFAALLYVLGSVVLGILAAAGGLAIASRFGNG
jgi:fluoride exporter